ncbi:phosphotransferase [Candidatus Rhabdochlamydia sp. T3358]|uniref:phosphotransferase n=1 Tax=Candidatus Rhabdochlamydia sp. T3358 TaxID=2099795 RepID=UPI0010B076ED|nr:phosphotransferase [Candidatus Rhabdochlamydia sp. T3358]VHO04603.1 Phosphotransferase enzyme family protein [Candidatus Rhabdochlamydia sp. T3358]
MEKLDGLSIWARSYKLTHEQTNQSIALRVLNSNQPAEERERELFLIQWMSELGIAPHVIEIDPSHGLISTVFIQSPEPKPWHMTKMTPDKVMQFATSLKLLHSQPLDIKNERLQELDDKVFKLAALHPQFQIFKTAIEKMQELDTIQHGHVPSKFCHNDVGHGGNTLWDGKKAWMIDWELAGNFNPYFDVASPMVLLFFNEENKDLFFRTYLGHTPSQREKDLLFVNQQYAYLRYGATSLGICHEPSKTFTLSPSEINQIGAWNDILTGKVLLKREEMQTDFGRCKTGVLLIHQALNNMKGEEFQAAISRLASNDKDY